MRSDRARIAELVSLTVVAAAVGSLLDGIPFWGAVICLAAVSGWGAFAFLLGYEPRGVPIESLAVPVVAAFGTLGIAHLVGAGPLALVALVVGGAVLGVSLALEKRLLGPEDAAGARRRNQLLELMLVVAFLAFAGVAGGIPGAIVEPHVAAGAIVPPLDQPSLVALAAGDAVVALVLGYRLAALRAVAVREAAWAAGTYAVVVAVVAAALRALALPRLLGPAVLTVAFYLWASYRAAPGAERRSFAWLWGYGILVVAAALTVAWNMLLR